MQIMHMPYALPCLKLIYKLLAAALQYPVQQCILCQSLPYSTLHAGVLGEVAASAARPAVA